MVMIKDNTAKEAQRTRQLAAAEQQSREQAERDAAPKRQVVLSATYQETIKAAVPGVSVAEFRGVPPGEPVLVTAEEWQRLRSLGVIVQTAGETAHGGQATLVPRQVPDEVYERAAQDIASKETDLDYAVKGIARHFMADADQVRKTLEQRTEARTQAVTAAQEASGKSGVTWDALPEDERSRLVDAQLKQRRVERTVVKQ